MVRLLILGFLLWVGGNTKLHSQTPPTTNDSIPRPLPSIQLQEFTIIGLSRITLPQKHRIELPLSVQTRWIQNPRLVQSSSPIRVFEFARKKPTIRYPITYPPLTVGIGYGSFQTFQGQIMFQPRLRHVAPFAYLHYQTSQGHLEGARRQILTFKTGLNGNLWQGNRLESQLFFSTISQGLWGPFYAQFGEHTIRRTLQGLQINLRQDMGNHISLSTEGYYQEFQHRNFRDTWQTQLALKGRLAYLGERIGLFIAANWQQASTWQKTPFPNANDTTFFKKPQTLGEALLGIQIALPAIDFTTGIRWQTWHTDSLAVHPTPLVPFFRVQVTPTPKWYLSTEFFSGVVIQPLEPLSRNLLPADFQNVTFVRSLARWHATLAFLPTHGLRVEYRWQLHQQEQLPVVYSAVSAPDSLSPLWWIRFDGKGKTVSHTLASRFDPGNRFQLRAAATFTFASLETHPQQQIPYVPRFNASFQGKWQFTPRLAFRLALRYIGTRYNDIFNRQILSPYLLLNAEGIIHLTNRWKIQVWGKNLLNQNYEQWRNFTAPGIHFGATVVFQ